MPKPRSRSRSHRRSRLRSIRSSLRRASKRLRRSLRRKSHKSAGKRKRRRSRRGRKHRGGGWPYINKDNDKYMYGGWGSSYKRRDIVGGWITIPPQYYPYKNDNK